MAKQISLLEVSDADLNFITELYQKIFKFNFSTTKFEGAYYANGSFNADAIDFLVEGCGVEI